MPKYDRSHPYAPTIFIPQLDTIPETQALVSNDERMRKMVKTVLQLTDPYKGHFGMKVIRMIIRILTFFVLGITLEGKPKNHFIDQHHTPRLHNAK